MRVNKLIMNAFGPYAKRVEINFSDLNQQELYLIAGDTGTGKTTIFDAISFAIYGNASQTIRASNQLRSDFADNEIETYVELYFTIHHKQYYLKRSPTYLRTGYKTENKHSASLLLPNNEVIDGVKEVNEKILEIMGIDYSQFKHIMMIAQGEFAQLINAESKERALIFRKMFDTAKYDQISLYFKEEVRKTQILNQQIKERITTIIKMNEGIEVVDNEIFQIQDFIERLDKQNQIDNQLLKKNIESRGLLNQENEECNKLIQQIESANLLLDKLKRAKEKEFLLVGKALKMEQLKTTIDLSLKAKLITPEFKQYQRGAGAYLSLNKEKELLDSELKQVEKDNIVISNNYQKFKQQEEVFLDKARTVEQLQQALITINKIEECEKQLKLIKETDLQLLTDLKRIEEDSFIKKDCLSNIKEQLESFPKIDLELEKLNQLEENCAKRMKDLQTLEQELIQLVTAKELYQNKLVDYEIVAEDFKKSQLYYIQQEQIYRTNQAGFLANDLITGNPCPVCGSLEHPNLASLSSTILNLNELETLKETISLLEVKREEAYLVVLNSKEELTKIQSLIESKTNRTTVKEHQIYLIDKKQVLRSDINELQVNRQRINKKIQEEKELREELVNLNTVIEMLSEDYFNKQAEINKIKTASQVLEQEVKTLKEGIFFIDLSKQEIIEKITDFQRLITKFKEDFTISKNNYEELLLKQGKMQGRLIQMNEQLEKDQVIIASLKKEWLNQLNNYFRDFEEYQEYYLKLEGVENAQNSYQEYLNQKMLIKKEIEELSKECIDLEYRDLTNYRIQLELNNQKLELLTEDYATIFSKFKKNSAIVKELNQEKELFKQIEKRLNMVDDLSKAMNGQNASRLSFESYVLTSYFDYIIEAANLRFKKMTGLRYELLRRKIPKGRLKAQGLDLEVLDFETGKVRDIKTLSGGESFKASLSLALGLSDVIQAQVGGIEIDTLFIDEGFGTLDAQSLDQAIEILMDLNHSNKVIGIISHVQELKERIDSKIIVKKVKRGSEISIEV